MDLGRVRRARSKDKENKKTKRRKGKVMEKRNVGECWIYILLGGCQGGRMAQYLP